MNRYLNFILQILISPLKIEQSMTPGAERNQGLEQQAIRSLGWRFSSIGTGFVVHFGVGVVLARLLPPEDFGLVGLAYIVMGFGNLFVNLGLGPALIQRKELTDRHIRVAFTLSLTMSIVMMGVLYVAIPYCAMLLKDERVAPILEVLAFGFILSGLGIVSNAILARRLAFQQLFYVSLLKACLFGPVAIGLALSGFGVRSLVYASILQQGVHSLASYIFARHTVFPLVARKEMKELVGFGAGMSLVSICNYFALQGDYFVVGRVLGPGPLGIYTRAYSLMTMPTTQFVQGLGSVLFPAASRIQNEPERFQRAYCYTLSVMSSITIPTMVAMVVLAPEIISGLYGPAWKEAVVPLQILGLFGVFRALYNGTATFVRAKGWVYRILLCQVVYGLAVFIGGWVGALYGGMKGVALVVGLSILLMWVLMSYYGNQATGTSLRDLLLTFRPGLIIGCITLFSCGTMKWGMNALKLPSLLVLVGSLVVGGVISLWAVVILPQHMLIHLPERMLESLRKALPARMQTFVEKSAQWMRRQRYVSFSLLNSLRGR
jgi:PST family polysaccharide transporter